jgi:hypothetical protein
MASQTPTGRVVAAARGAGAEGATAPESLRPTDRRGETTLESRWLHHLADGASPVGRSSQAR